MASLDTKIENALDETRILMLGAQVLLGFSYRSFFERGFSRLPTDARFLLVGGLALMALTVGLLLSPPAFHRIVEDGLESSRFHRYVTAIAALALIPFALGLGIDVFVAAGLLFSRPAAAAMGVAALLLASFWWFGIEALRRPRRKSDSPRETRRRNTDLSERIKNVLTEVRVVLPGAQALLGF